MRLIVCLFALLLLTPLLSADELWTGSADVKFKGYSTLHDFEGTVKAVPLKVKVSGEKGSRSVDASSDVAVKEMSTANKDRDRNMWNMFKEAEFKLIKVEVDNAREGDLKPKAGASGTMPVALTIAGTRGKANAAVTKVSETPTDVSFDLAFPVSLKAFKLDPPKAMGGLVSVKDSVDVTAHVTLRKARTE